MRTAYGQVVDVRKYRGIGQVKVSIEFPIESYKDMVELLDEKTVLLIPANIASQFGVVELNGIGEDVQQALESAPQDQDVPRGLANLRVYAVVLCKTTSFQRWVFEMVGGDISDLDGDAAETMAKNYILSACGIESRTELETNRDAQDKFHNLVRRPYAEWARYNGVQERR